jgi:hypothetical protein
MAMSIQDFIAHAGAEVVGDKIIVGEMANRRVIGDMVPVVVLTEEGQAMLAAAEAEAVQESKPRVPRHMKPKAETAAPAPDAPAGDATETPAA